MLDDLTKPLDTLINRTGDGIVGFLKPWQMKRIAKADIKIQQMKAIAEIKGNSFIDQTQRDLVSRKIVELSNLHNIMFEARKHVDVSKVMQELSSTFKDHFIDNSKLENDEFLQQLWGRLLAGEINEKGLFDKRTLQFVKNLSHQEARSLEELMRHSIKFDNNYELVLPISTFNGLKSTGLTNEMINHFEHLGIFSRSEPRTTFIVSSKTTKEQTKFKLLSSSDGKIILYAILSPVNAKKLEHGEYFAVTKTPLTRLGKQLSKLIVPNSSRKNRKAIFSEIKELNKFSFNISFGRSF